MSRNYPSGARLRAVIAKELCHIVRDWQTLMIVIAMPVVMMFLYGYAINMEMKEAPVVIVDADPSPASKAIGDAIDASSLFTVTAVIYGYADPVTLFKRYNAKAVVIFDGRFSENLRRSGKSGTVTVLVNGGDPNQGTIIRNTIEGLIQRATLAVLHIEQPKIVTIRQKVLYNPQQQSALYFVPGLMAVIVLMISALLTALALTREKELGTMEQLLVSPLLPLEIIIGKIVPYIFLAAIDAVVILLISHLVFGVVVQGSLWILALATLVYIFTSLALGLFFSTLAKTQQQAMLMVFPATMLPTIILSGFIFPVASMPLFLQAVSYLVPATYYLQLIRGIILKGVGLEVLWLPLSVLCIQGLLFTAISIKKFRIRL